METIVSRKLELVTQYGALLYQNIWNPCNVYAMTWTMRQILYDTLKLLNGTPLLLKCSYIPREAPLAYKKPDLDETIQSIVKWRNVTGCLLCFFSRLHSETWKAASQVVLFR